MAYLGVFDQNRDLIKLSAAPRELEPSTRAKPRELLLEGLCSLWRLADAVRRQDCGPAGQECQCGGAFRRQGVRASRELRHLAEAAARGAACDNHAPRRLSEAGSA